MAGDTELQRFWRTPFDDKQIERTVGDIHILAERCKGCAYCAEYCPLEVLAMSSRFNLKGYHPPEVAKEETCVACHLCEVICPEFAIFITGDNGEKDADLTTAEEEDLS